MKRFILIELLRQLQDRPRLYRKVKVLAWVASIFVVLMGGVVIYAGVWGVGYLSRTAQNIELSPISSSLYETFKTPSKVMNSECVVMAKDLLSFNNLLEIPWARSAKSLKDACWGPSSEQNQSNEYLRI